MFRKVSILLATLIVLAAFSTVAVQAKDNTPSMGAGSIVADKDPCRDEQGNEICPYYSVWDNRINHMDALATIVGYCKQDSIEIYGVFGSTGEYLYNASHTAILNGLSSAKSRKTNVVIQESRGRQLIALPSGHLQMYAEGYSYTFSPEYCGIRYSPSGAPVSNPGSTGGTTNAGTNTGGTTTTTGVISTTVVTNTTLIADLNFRAGPSVTSQRIGGIIANNKVGVIGRDASAEWLKISFEDKIGWIAAKYTTIIPAVLEKLPVVQ